MIQAVAFKSSTQKLHRHHPGLPFGALVCFQVVQQESTSNEVRDVEDENGESNEIYHFNLRNKNDVAHWEQYISTEAVVMQI